MHAPPISLGRNGKLGGLPSGGSQDRLWTFGDLSDIAAQLVGLFGLYPCSLAWSSPFFDLPALCRRYRFRPLGPPRPAGRDRAVVVVRQRDGSRRPRIVQIVFQSVFVSEAIEAVRRWVLRSGKHNQDRVPVVGAIAPSPAEDTIAVLPHHPEATIPANVEPRGWVHPPDSTVRPVNWTEKILN